MLFRYLESFWRLWRSYWFPETTTLSLAVCRILLIAGQLLFFLPSLKSQLMFVQPFRGFIDPQIIIIAVSQVVPVEVFTTPGALKLIYWFTVAAGITTLVGLYTRTSAFVFALGNWFLVAHTYSYGEDHHPEAILCIFLMLLAFSPSGERLSLDELIARYRLRSGTKRRQESREEINTAVWPLKVTQFLLCFAYVSTGLAKLVYGGLAWMNGYTLQQIIFTSAIARDIPLGLWLAQQHILCKLLSVTVVLFEVFFFLCFLFPKTLPYFLFGGILLHVGIYFAEGSDFFQYILLYLVFIDFDKWFGKVKALVRVRRYDVDAIESSRIAAQV